MSLLLSLFFCSIPSPTTKLHSTLCICIKVNNHSIYLAVSNCILEGTVCFVSDSSSKKSRRSSLGKLFRRTKKGGSAKGFKRFSEPVPKPRKSLSLSQSLKLRFSRFIVRRFMCTVTVHTYVWYHRCIYKARVCINWNLL